VRRPSAGRGGFTLLEVLVASTIMAVAVGSLLSALSTSLRNASRLTENDRAAVLAQRTMDQLLADPAIPLGQDFGRPWEPVESGGLPGGFRARLDVFERVQNLPPDKAALERLALEIWWITGAGQRRTFRLEGYRIAPRRGP